MNKDYEMGCLTWLGIGIGWLVLWYFILSSKYNSATAGLPACAWYDFSISCNSPWQRANSDFSSGMMIAFISIPFPALLWKKLQEMNSKGSARRQVRRDQLEIDRKNRDSDAKLLLANEQAQNAKGRLDRTEFVQNLSAACSYLEILPLEEDKQRILKIRQNISKELTALVATYSLSQMISLLNEDPALAIKLRSMLKMIDESSVNSSDAEVLSTALSMIRPRKIR